ncbi:MAG: hypothetical protein NC833_05375 [Candidatus Omnitrophica bacterium]|nr:hypothetical protein [Candidatus Omnitrophota bacterium]
MKKFLSLFFLIICFTFADLRENVILYCGFENTTDIYLPEKKIFINSYFRRNSHAYTYDFKRFEKDQPRYVEGKIGKGLFLESGWYGVFERSSENLIPLISSKAENFEDGFGIIGSADFKIHRGQKALVSENLVKIICKDGNYGIEIKTFEIPVITRYIFSVYLKGERGEEKIKLVIEDLTNQITEEKEFVLKKDWYRYFIILPYDSVSKNYKGKELKSPAKIKLKILSTEEGSFYFDALMFEPPGGYSARFSPSTWIEGGEKRYSEVFQIPFETYTFNIKEGSISFWAKYGDGKLIRTFLYIGFGWNKVISLSEYQSNVLNFYVFGENYKEKLPEPNIWHFFVISWKDNKFSLYIDGIKKTELTVEKEINQDIFKEQLFILPGNCHSGFFAGRTHINGIIDEFYIFNKSLEKDEIEQLMKVDKPIIEYPEISVKYEQFFNILPRCKEGARLKLSIQNLSNQQKKLSVYFKIEYLDKLFYVLNLKGLERKEILLNVPTEKLMPGNYRIKIELKDGEKIYNSNFDFGVGLWKDEDKLPIIAWNAGEKSFEEMKTVKELGVNVIPFSHISYKPLDWANQLGISLLSHMHIRPNVREDYLEDKILKNDGEYDGPNPLSKYVLDSARKKAKEWMESLKNNYLRNGDQTVKYLIVNTEWQLPMDFGEKFKNIVERKFKIDLSKWQTDTKNAWKYLHPLNRLAYIKELVEGPEDGIVKKDDNFYNFHFWYHEGYANEIAINKICIEEIKKEREDIKVIIEPILRYPPKKKYERIDIAQEWFYYENPKKTVWIQENLTALTRGKDIKISGMPQFLFKAHAQPFAITPPPDLFKQATLLCLSRPLDILTFWGWHNVLEKAKDYYTIEQMEEKTKNYDIDSKKWTKEQLEEVRKGGENGLGFVYVPETKQAFLSISKEYFLPFGKLFRKWENYPRKIAVLNSFASWIYSNVRWPSYGYLGDAVISSGLPFDVYWDEDFIGSSEILNNYDVLVLPQTYAITIDTYNAIKNFVERGGKVLVDDVFNVRGIDKNIYSFKEEEKEKIKNFVRENVKLPVKIIGDDVLINILKFKDVNYLFIVNCKNDFGRYLGRWGKIKEKGVENKIKLIIEEDFGDFLYDLNENRIISGNKKENSTEIELNLSGAEGKILYISKEKLIEVEIKTEKSKIKKGEQQKFSVILKGNKNLMTGVPLKIEIITPENEISDLSGYYLCEDGIFNFPFYLPLNAKEGEWKINIKEFLTGKEKNISFFVI